MNSGYTHLQIATLKNAMTALPVIGAQVDDRNFKR